MLHEQITVTSDEQCVPISIYKRLTLGTEIRYKKYGETIVLPANLLSVCQITYMDAIGGLAALSPREKEVLELAAEGLTDVQIGKRLGISAGTVNSYWVRIRGKVGQQSRTELVANSLRAESGARLKLAEQENDQLNRELDERRRAEPAFAAAGSVFRAAFYALPEATLVLDERGFVLFANDKAGELVGVFAEELEGADFTALIQPRMREVVRAHLHATLEGSDEFSVGDGQVLMLDCPDGHTRRVTFQTRAATYELGHIITLVLKDYNRELSARIKRASSIVTSFEEEPRLE